MSDDGLRQHVKSMFAIAELERMPKELEITYAQAEDTFSELIRREREEAFGEGMKAVLDGQMKWRAKGHDYMSANMFANPYQEDA